MKAKDIKKLAEDLRENYNTRNPFELAEKYGIRVVVSKMLPIDRKAYTIRSLHLSYLLDFTSIRVTYLSKSL